MKLVKTARASLKPKYQPLQTVQELADILVPTINTLKSHIQCMATFHDHDLLYTNMLSPTLIDTILNCIPPLICPTFLP